MVRNNRPWRTKVKSLFCRIIYF
ncbi:hypothetical protein [Escherichia albertii]